MYRVALWREVLIKLWVCAKKEGDKCNPQVKTFENILVEIDKPFNSQGACSLIMNIFMDEQSNCRK